MDTKLKVDTTIFLEGNIINPYLPSICDIGYIGEGKYTARTKCKNLKIYDAWRSMIKRCYDKKELERFPTYIGCTVCEQWHNFQTFAQWCEINYYEVDNETMCIDKDILHKGNKIYSPENCIFVTERINTLFIKSNKLRGELPIGVSKSGNKYVSRCSVLNNDRIYLGIFNTAKLAFQAYKQFKETYIREVADKYKNIIPKELYDAMYSWEVEITD